MMPIRKAARSDVSAMRSIYAPFVSDSAVSFETEVPDEATFGLRFAEVTADNPWLVFEQSGTIAGYSYASLFRSRAAFSRTRETTVYVAPEFQGSGVGMALMVELLDELREAGTHLAVAAITLPNDASVGLHERLGFEPVGVFNDVGRKFDQWHDVGFWQLSLSR